ncbi:hypothetical protein Tco_0986358, partial [Tanacetum coccineum]
MLVQPIENEGEVSERPSESQLIPSPTHPSKDQPESQPDPSPRPSSFILIPNSNPEGSGGNHGGQSSSDRSLSGAARLKKQQKKKDMEKSNKRRSVSKQGRKSVKYSKATLNEAMDYTLAQNEGKTDSKVEEPKTSSKTKELHLSDEGTNKQDKDTDRQVEGTVENKDQDSRESATPTAPTTTSIPTLTVFSDDETIAQVLVIMNQN